MSTIDDLQTDVMRCARAWGHYINLRSKIHKKPPNLTEQALLDAIVELDVAIAKKLEKVAKKKPKKKRKVVKEDNWFEGWSKVIKNSGKKESEEDLTCQQCMQPFVEKTSFANDNKRFCSNECEKTFEKQLYDEDKKENEDENDP